MKTKRRKVTLPCKLFLVRSSITGTSPEIELDLEQQELVHAATNLCNALTNDEWEHIKNIQKQHRDLNAR